MLEIEGDIYLIGDIHGKKFQLVEKIKDLNIADAHLILLGDIGVGFNDNNYAFDYGWLNDELKSLIVKLICFEEIMTTLLIGKMI